MRSAVKSINITPPIGLPIGGNVRDDNLSRGVHDDLFCNAVLLEDDGEMVCFLSFDLLGLHYDSCQYIKSQIAKKTGLSSSKIVINCTHTHSGPDVVDFFKTEIDKICLKYIENIAEVISDEAEDMLKHLAESKLSISKQLVYDLSFNRRLIMKDGTMKMNWEDIDIEKFDREAGPIDPELFVISITEPDGKIKALMVNFTLHPAVLVGKDWMWSRDYIHYLDTYLKSKFGNNVVVFFANGAEGNINHLNFRDKNQNRGFEEAERIGQKLGQYVTEALEHPESLVRPLKCISRTIKLPLREITEHDIKNAEKLLEERGDIIPSLLDGVPDEIYAREIIKLSKYKDNFVETEIQAVRMGDSVIVTLPGEVFVEFGLQIKELSQYKNTLIFGLANDCIGYVPTLVSFSEGGYEIKTASSSKLDKSAGDILVSEIKKLMTEL